MRRTKYLRLLPIVAMALVTHGVAVAATPSLEGGADASLAKVTRSFFIANRGQVERGVEYEVVVPGGPRVNLAGGRVAFAPAERDARAVGSPFLMMLVGAAPVGLEGAERAAENVAYWFSGDIAHPQVGVPRFGALSQRQVYGGIDVRHEAFEGMLQRAFVIAPGADPGQVRIRYRGASPPALQADGRLLVGTVFEHAPAARSAGRALEARFVPVGDDTFGVAVDGRDASRPLEIVLRLDYRSWLPAALAASPIPRLADHPLLLERLPGASPGDLLLFSTGRPAWNAADRPDTPNRTTVARSAASTPDRRRSAATFTGGDQACASLTLADGDVFDPTTPFTNFQELVIPAGATVTISPAGTLDISAAVMRIDGTLDTGATGSAGGASVNGLSDGVAGSGPGGGAGGTQNNFFVEQSGGGGGGYGGVGGSGGVSTSSGGPTPAAGGTTYGMALPPGIELGSGGGSGAAVGVGLPSGAGGAGGGALSLRANVLVVNGTVRANGAVGGPGNQTPPDETSAGGGGSGGGVLLESSRNTLGSGTVEVLGGTGGGGTFFGGEGAGGGGGRIKFAGALDPTSTIATDASGGIPGVGSSANNIPPTAGAAGSVDSSTTTGPNPAGANVTNCGTDTDLAVTITLDTAGPYQQGQTVQFTITVQNLSVTEAFGVVLSGLPSGLTLDSVSGGGCTTLPCALANLAGGGSVVITVQATLLGGFQFSLDSTVTQGAPDPVPGNNSDVAGGVINSVPTLGGWAVAVLVLMLACGAIWVLARRA